MKLHLKYIVTLVITALVCIFAYQTYWLMGLYQSQEKVSALEARLKAYEEYDKFRVIQDREFLSDFDKEVMRLKGELGLFDN